MGKFKVGDRVTVKNNVVDSFYAGETGVVTRMTGKPYPYRVEFDGYFDVFNEEELDHSKEHKVLTILREYEKNRKVLQRQSRG